jgi:hypothetical protein
LTASITMNAPPRYVHPEILDGKRWKSYKIGAEKITKL